MKEALERSRIKPRQDHNGHGWFLEQEGDWRGSQHRKLKISVKGEVTSPYVQARPVGAIGTYS